MGHIFNANYWKKKLDLTRHVEGGSFREIYRSALELSQDLLHTHKGPRAASTSIYFLLETGEFSAFHRIASDEIWHFYDGDTLVIYEIDRNGLLNRYLLGKSTDEDISLQVLIPAGSWFASRVEAPGAYALCGCTVAPGFDFDDFELGDRGVLQNRYPAYSNLIASLTHPSV